MFIDPLEQWLWHTPTPLPKEPSHSIQAEVLQDVHKLNDLGRLADPRLIDFWQNTAVTNDQHTPFRYERLTIAIAALALIAIRG